MNNFYDTFKLGIEVEGEFFSDCPEIGLSHWTVDEDGSMDEIGFKNLDTFCWELQSKVIKSEEDEKETLNDLLKLLKVKSGFGREIIATRNNSCGTHIHFSFKKVSDHLLYLFDTIEFEKYFFKRYLSFFKNQKFISRLENKYCRAFASRESGKFNFSLLDIENKKKNRDKYFWLNVRSISQGTGIEIRVFPHMQTISGIKEVIEFTKSVVNGFYNLKTTPKKLKLINFFFNNIYNKRFDEKKLSDQKQIIFKGLDIRDSSDISGDVMIMLSKWAIKAPKTIAPTRRQRRRELSIETHDSGYSVEYMANNIIGQFNTPTRLRAPF